MRDLILPVLVSLVGLALLWAGCRWDYLTLIMVGLLAHLGAWGWYTLALWCREEAESRREHAPWWERMP